MPRRKAIKRTADGRFAKRRAPKKRGPSIARRIGEALRDSGQVEHAHITVEPVTDHYKRPTVVISIDWEDPLDSSEAAEILSVIKPVILEIFDGGKAQIGINAYQLDAAGDIEPIGSPSLTKMWPIRQSFESATDDLFADTQATPGYFQGGYRADLIGGLFLWIQPA